MADDRPDDGFQFNISDEKRKGDRGQRIARESEDRSEQAQSARWLAARSIGLVGDPHGLLPYFQNPVRTKEQRDDDINSGLGTK